jgi:hypothetical protein
MKFVQMDAESSMSGLLSSSIHEAASYLPVPPHCNYGKFHVLVLYFCVCKPCVAVGTTWIFKIELHANVKVVSCYCHWSDLPVPSLPSINAENCVSYSFYGWHC